MSGSLDSARDILFRLTARTRNTMNEKGMSKSSHCCFCVNFAMFFEVMDNETVGSSTILLQLLQGRGIVKMLSGFFSFSHDVLKAAASTTSFPTAEFRQQH